jgi:hypothetical protein
VNGNVIFGHGIFLELWERNVSKEPKEMFAF